jgi:hypothetical protein
MLEEGRDDEAKQQSAGFFLLPSPLSRANYDRNGECARRARPAGGKLLHLTYPKQSLARADRSVAIIAHLRSS